MRDAATRSELPSGFSMRPAQAGDLEPCLELINLCARAQTGRDDLTLDQLRSEWSAPGVDPAAQMRLVEDAHGRIVGYIEVWDHDNPPIDVWVWGRIHPDFEGRGIGTALMTWARRRAQRAIERCPSGARVVIRSGAHSRHVPTHTLFEDLGMTPIRHFRRMHTVFEGVPPTEPDWPDGMTVRSYRHPQDLEATLDADTGAFRDHWGFIERSHEEEIVKWRHWVESDPDFDPNLWFLAMDGEEIAGICLCSPTDWSMPGYGHVSRMGVLRPWRRRGIGAALLLHAFGEMFRRGKSGVSLGVDADSITGATRLYERVGMVVDQQRDVYELELRPGIDLTNVG